MHISLASGGGRKSQHFKYGSLRNCKEWHQVLVLDVSGAIRKRNKGSQEKGSYKMLKEVQLVEEFIPVNSSQTTCRMFHNGQLHLESIPH